MLSGSRTAEGKKINLTLLHLALIPNPTSWIDFVLCQN
jgi:hypothetical protein